METQEQNIKKIKHSATLWSIFSFVIIFPTLFIGLGGFLSFIGWHITIFYALLIFLVSIFSAAAFPAIVFMFRKNKYTPEERKAFIKRTVKSVLITAVIGSIVALCFVWLLLNNVAKYQDKIFINP